MEQNTLENIPKKKSYRGTIGGSQAGRNLDNILNETCDPDLTRAVLKIITSFQKVIKGIKPIENVGLRSNVANLLFQQFVENINTHQFPTIIDTHLKNVLTTIKRSASF